MVPSLEGQGLIAIAFLHSWLGFGYWWELVLWIFFFKGVPFPLFTPLVITLSTMHCVDLFVLLIGTLILLIALHFWFGWEAVSWFSVHVYYGWSLLLLLDLFKVLEVWKSGHVCMQITSFCAATSYHFLEITMQFLFGHSNLVQLLLKSIWRFSYLGLECLPVDHGLSQGSCRPWI